MNEMNKQPETCNQCPNHCPADDLHCGRGRAYFANLNGESQGEISHREIPREDGYLPEHGPHHRHEFHGEHGPHDDPRPHHGPRPHGPRPEINADSSLETLMHACGHRLHHDRIRGGAGSQEQILSLLVKNEGAADQKALQEALRIRPASASELLTKLEDKGLITRARDEEDRRKVQISLTEEGRAKAEKLPETFEKPDLFAALDEEEQASLKALLLKLLESWK